MEIVHTRTNRGTFSDASKMMEVLDTITMEAQETLVYWSHLLSTGDRRGRGARGARVRHT